MNYVDTIKRAFRITWMHKSLWLLGFLASLGSGGSGSGVGTGGNADGQQDLGRMPGWMGDSQLGNEFNRWMSDNSGVILALTCALLCVFFIIWIATLVLGEIGQGGLIANVDGIERGGSPSFGDGWRAGAARVRTLVGMRLLLAIPGILLGAIFAAIVVITIVGAAGSAAGGRSGDDMFSTILGAGILSIVCLFLPLLCIFAIYGLLVGILETFGRRAIVLENLGAIDGLKRGWAVFRSRIGDSIVLAILLAVVGFVVGIVIAIPLAVFGVGAVVGTAVLSNGIENMPWALVAVGILLFVVLAAVIGSYFTAMNSAVWTLAYREFAAPPPTPMSATTTDAGQPAIESGQPPARPERSEGTDGAPSAEGAP